MYRFADNIVGTTGRKRHTGASAKAADHRHVHLGNHHIDISELQDADGFFQYVLQFQNQFFSRCWNGRFWISFSIPWGIIISGGAFCLWGWEKMNQFRQTATTDHLFSPGGSSEKKSCQTFYQPVGFLSIICRNRRGLNSIRYCYFYLFYNCRLAWFLLIYTEQHPH